MLVEMATARARAALVFVALLQMAAVVVVRASHVVYPELQSLEAKHVDGKLRTGYHFQPPKHWINGTYDDRFALSSLIDIILTSCYSLLSVSSSVHDDQIRTVRKRLITRP